jgi:hypothetical protein
MHSHNSSQVLFRSICKFVKLACPKMHTKAMFADLSALHRLITGREG